MFQGLADLLSNPLFWKLLISFWIFNAAVTSMPMPKDGGSDWYKFTFTFLHSLAGSARRAAFAMKIPGAEQ